MQKPRSQRDTSLQNLVSPTSGGGIKRNLNKRLALLAVEPIGICLTLSGQETNASRLVSKRFPIAETRRARGCANTPLHFDECTSS
jgi:hypothetical protein